MATGSGKTYTAVTQVYRLAKFAKIKRALFLVDRGNLATNAKDEFEQFVIPHDGRKFTQHYNVNILGRAGIPDATKVTISTIQRLYSQLTNQEFDDSADERSGFEMDWVHDVHDYMDVGGRATQGAVAEGSTNAAGGMDDLSGQRSNAEWNPQGSYSEPEATVAKQAISRCHHSAVIANLAKQGEAISEFNH